ncbi:MULTISPECIES: HEPN domain-containing protein [unclassified Microcoleus]|uniref:HEPN domain-containing protein n=1 Tax=unclassified Microcoleus TaxID=2642155 RepID=UPI002FD0D77F
MKPEQLELIQKSRESISAAKLLLDNGFPGYAAARAYYAMFYIAEAFLAEQINCAEQFIELDQNLIGTLPSS